MLNVTLDTGNNIIGHQGGAASHWCSDTVYDRVAHAPANQITGEEEWKQFPQQKTFLFIYFKLVLFLLLLFCESEMAVTDAERAVQGQTSPTVLL